MANDTDSLVKNTLAKVAEYVKEVATMTVQTEYTRVDAGENANFDQAKPAALTVIKLDGDCRAVIPNVATAIEYRARIIDSLLSAFQSRFK